MGDLSCLMPVIHPYCRGAAGPAHSDDYRIESVDRACMNSVKVQLLLLELLLQNNAAEAQSIVDNYTPVYNSLEAYLRDLDRLMIDKDAVEYRDDGTVLLR
jgi:hypothetical protein